MVRAGERDLLKSRNTRGRRRGREKFPRSGVNARTNSGRSVQWHQWGEGRNSGCSERRNNNTARLSGSGPATLRYARRSLSSRTRARARTRTYAQGDIIADESVHNLAMHHTFSVRPLCTRGGPGRLCLLRGFSSRLNKYVLKTPPLPLPPRFAERLPEALNASRWSFLAGSLRDLSLRWKRDRSWSVSRGSRGNRKEFGMAQSLVERGGAVPWRNPRVLRVRRRKTIAKRSYWLYPAATKVLSLFFFFRFRHTFQLGRIQRIPISGPQLRVRVSPSPSLFPPRIPITDTRGGHYRGVHSLTASRWGNSLLRGYIQSAIDGCLGKVEGDSCPRGAATERSAARRDRTVTFRKGHESWNLCARESSAFSMFDARNLGRGCVLDGHVSHASTWR